MNAPPASTVRMTLAQPRARATFAKKPSKKGKKAAAGAGSKPHPEEPAKGPVEKKSGKPKPAKPLKEAAEAKAPEAKAAAKKAPAKKAPKKA